jgi:hypothetical protein
MGHQLIFIWKIYFWKIKIGRWYIKSSSNNELCRWKVSQSIRLAISPFLSYFLCLSEQFFIFYVHELASHLVHLSGKTYTSHNSFRPMHKIFFGSIKLHERTQSVQICLFGHSNGPVNTQHQQKCIKICTNLLFRIPPSISNVNHWNVHHAILTWFMLTEIPISLKIFLKSAGNASV